MSLKPIVLVGEQKRVLFLPHTNPIQIKGVAGSGKTTVAMYRAKHLIDTYGQLFDEPHAVIFTFNKSLTTYIEELLPQVVGGYREDSETPVNPTVGLRITVTTFHKWAYDYLRSKGVFNKFSVAETNEQYRCIRSAINVTKGMHSHASILEKSPDFFQEEFGWIKGKMFLSEPEYVGTARLGRGTRDRVTKEDKVIIWKCYQAYQLALAGKKLIDFDDFALLAHSELTQDTAFVPPFSHIVIDEAQDLNKCQISVIKKLVSPVTNSITIIADAAQRIYKSGFTWSEVGLNITGGRSIEFKRNYRNTFEIATSANSLLMHEGERDEFTATEVSSIRQHGDKPTIVVHRSKSDSMQFLVQKLRTVDLTKESVVVLHRNRRDLDNISKLILQNGVATEVIQRSFGSFSLPTVKVCTLSSIKGLEFDHVFILDVNEDTVPSLASNADSGDEYHVSTERRLLYTAMTRAMRSLCLIVSGTPSRFVKEIDPASIEMLHFATESSVEIETNLRTERIDDLPF